MSGVRLDDADMSLAELRSNFNDASMMRADLRGSNLTSANLNGANLTEANLADATLADAQMSRVRMTGAIGPGGQRVKSPSKKPTQKSPWWQFWK
jgi:uncharacterized protein YjbI with pentapeptide repeats